MGDAKIEQHTSPYSCPYQGESYCGSLARQYLETLADAKEFLGRLGGMTLVCDCVLTHSECWAIILAGAAEYVCGFSSSFDSEGRGSSGSSYVSQSFDVCSNTCELVGGVPEGLVSLSHASGSEHSFVHGAGC